MNPLHHLKLALVWRREYRRVLAELATYSDRELATDLRLHASDTPGIAAEAADQRVAAFVRNNPIYRGALAWRGQAAPGWAG